MPRGSNRNSKEKDAKKYTAYQVYDQAICSGILTPNKHCENCLAAGRINGHHPDYDKPLSVVWLCDTCHSRAHHIQNTFRLNKFEDRTSKDLTIQGKEELYKKIGIHNTKQNSVENRYTPMELKELQECQMLADKAISMAMYYYRQVENMRWELNEKYYLQNGRCL